MRPTVFIPEPMAPSGLDQLEPHCECVAPWRHGIELSAGAKSARLGEADAVIVRLFRVGARELEACPRLRVIAKQGVGLDNIDCEAATRRGIPVLFAPGANANAVAEHTVGVLIALSRHFESAGRALREGRFHERDRFQGTELAGRTLGIVGLGRIGSRVAQKAGVGLAMRVLAYDPFVDRQAYDGPAVFVDRLEELLEAADFVSLHVPLTSLTRHMIDVTALGRLKPTCRVINTSRGAVVDEPALVRALREGRIAGAALDVFSEEPVPADHPLASTPNTILTPHVAGATDEAFDALSRQIAADVLALLQGRGPPLDHVVNPEVLGEGMQ